MTDRANRSWATKPQGEYAQRRHYYNPADKEQRLKIFTELYPQIARALRARGFWEMDDKERDLKAWEFIRATPIDYGEEDS
jgi:hypothetical protein